MLIFLVALISILIFSFNLAAKRSQRQNMVKYTPPADDYRAFFEGEKRYNINSPAGPGQYIGFMTVGIFFCNGLALPANFQRLGKVSIAMNRTDALSKYIDIELDSDENESKFYGSEEYYWVNPYLCIGNRKDLVDTPNTNVFEINPSGTTVALPHLNPSTQNLIPGITNWAYDIPAAITPGYHSMHLMSLATAGSTTGIRYMMGLGAGTNGYSIKILKSSYQKNDIFSNTGTTVPKFCTVDTTLTEPVVSLWKWVKPYFVSCN